MKHPVNFLFLGISESFTGDEKKCKRERARGNVVWRARFLLLFYRGHFFCCSGCYSMDICYPCKILPVSFEIEFSEWCAIAPPFVNILSFVIMNMMILNCKAEEIEVCILVFNSSHKTHNTNLMLYQI